MLARLDLPPLGSAGSGDPGDTFDTWPPTGVSFSGTARSVAFAGTADQIGFDNITQGSSIPGGETQPSALTKPVPTLGQWGGLLLALGFAVAGLRRLRAAHS